MRAETVPLPDPSRLLRELDLHAPLIGLYDAPEPKPSRRSWRRGRARAADRVSSTSIAAGRRARRSTSPRTTHGCGGCGRSLFGVHRERDDLIDFLWKDEGLRASRDLMADWVDNAPTYRPVHANVMVGPLKPELAAYLRTITFWVNADQLCVLQHGAYHHHAWGEPDPVTVPFGSGCSELVVPFRDLDAPQAVIGGTDIAMRDGLPPELIAFTVTLPLFAQLCALGDESFLGKGFLARLRKARGGSLA